MHPQAAAASVFDQYNMPPYSINNSILCACDCDILYTYDYPTVGFINFAVLHQRVQVVVSGVRGQLVRACI